MFNRNNQRPSLRQPKIFQAPQEVLKEGWSKVIIYLCLFILVVGCVFYAIFFSAIFKIKTVEIVGSPSKDIKRALDLMVGKNLFSFNCGKMEQSFLDIDKNYSRIKIYRGIPDTIRIVFEDREPKLIWQTNNQKFLVDKSAIAFKIADSPIKVPLVIDKSDLSLKIPAVVASENFVDFVKSIDIELSKIKFNIVNYEVGQTTFQVTAVTDNNLKILFNTLRPVSDQIDALNKVYSQKKQEIKEYIDLRVEGKVYYK